MVKCTYSVAMLLSLSVRACCGMNISLMMWLCFAAILITLSLICNIGDSGKLLLARLKGSVCQHQSVVLLQSGSPQMPPPPRGENLVSNTKCVHMLILPPVWLWHHTAQPSSHCRCCQLPSESVVNNRWLHWQQMWYDVKVEQEASQLLFAVAVFLFLMIMYITVHIIAYD